MTGSDTVDFSFALHLSGAVLQSKKNHKRFKGMHWGLPTPFHTYPIHLPLNT